MQWYRVVFSEDQIENQGLLNKLKDQFLAIYMKAEDTTEMALISDDEYQNDRISIYFSPACSPNCDVLIRFYGGTACPPPLRAESFILAGDEDVLDSLR